MVVFRLSRALLKRIARIIILSLCIGMAVGYLSFYMMMPSVSVPQTSNPSLAVAGLILLVVGVLAGALSDDLESMTIEALSGIGIGVVVGWLLFISPSANPDIVIPNAGGYIYNVIHAALPLIILAAVALFIGGFIGGMIMESMQAKGAPSVFDKISAGKKVE
jgi:hypothetical protein